MKSEGYLCVFETSTIIELAKPPKDTHQLEFHTNNIVEPKDYSRRIKNPAAKFENTSQSGVKLFRGFK